MFKIILKFIEIVLYIIVIVTNFYIIYICELINKKIQIEKIFILVMINYILLGFLIIIGKILTC